jgi:lysophospholipid acyltransferase (LPLAT)-like uncharacterized protein
MKLRGVNPAGSEVHHLSAWRRIVLWPLARLVRLWTRSLRFEVSPAAKAAIQSAEDAVVFVIWHNRLFVIPECYHRYRRGRSMYGLISASGDGAWLAAFFSLLNIGAIRGSSSRKGREAATALVEVLRAGSAVGITPDGPRGPCYDFKPGALAVARHARAPLLLFGAEFSSAWRLGSWDRFYLPVPFSRVRIHCEKITPDAFDDNAAAIAARMRAINPDRD